MFRNIVPHMEILQSTLRKDKTNFLDLLNYVNEQLKGIYNVFLLALTNAKENNGCSIIAFFSICCTPERAQGYAFIGTIIDYN